MRNSEKDFPRFLKFLPSCLSVLYPYVVKRLGLQALSYRNNFPSLFFFFFKDYRIYVIVLLLGRFC